MASWLSKVGRLLAGYLNRETHVHGVMTQQTPQQLITSLQPGDVLLVEGNRRVSTAIKYLTQSTWSHAALFFGWDHGYAIPPAHCLIDADTVEGVRTVAIDDYLKLNTRICRPVGLSNADCHKVITYAMARLSNQYDLSNVIDLARYLIHTPPVSKNHRRRMIALDSGDPTRAICCTLIAQSFQSIYYPILPLVERQDLYGM